jgi:hypothetical protein
MFLFVVKYIPSVDWFYCFFKCRFKNIEHLPFYYWFKEINYFAIVKKTPYESDVRKMEDIWFKAGVTFYIEDDFMHTCTCDKHYKHIDTLLLHYTLVILSTLPTVFSVLLNVISNVLSWGNLVTFKCPAEYSLSMSCQQEIL